MFSISKFLKKVGKAIKRVAKEFAIRAAAAAIGGPEGAFAAEIFIRTSEAGVKQALRNRTDSTLASAITGLQSLGVPKATLVGVIAVGGLPRILENFIRGRLAESAIRQELEAGGFEFIEQVLFLDPKTGTVARIDFVLFRSKAISPRDIDEIGFLEVKTSLIGRFRLSRNQKIVFAAIEDGTAIPLSRRVALPPFGLAPGVPLSDPAQRLAPPPFNVIIREVE